MYVYPLTPFGTKKMKFSEYQASKKKWKESEGDAPKAEPKAEAKPKRTERRWRRQPPPPPTAYERDPDTERIERRMQLERRIHGDHLQRVASQPRRRVFHAVSAEQMEYLLGEKIRDEELLAAPYRHHWTLLLMRIITPALFTALFFGLFWFGLTANIALLSLIIFIPLAVAVFFLVYVVHDWLNDYLVVTNYRFLRVRRQRFIDNQRAQLPVDDAEESRLSKSNNPIQWIFNIGQISIPGAGAGSGNAITFKWIKNPEAVQKVVENARKANRTRVTQERERNILKYAVNKRDNKPTVIMPPDLSRLKPVVEGESFWHTLVPVHPEVPAGANPEYKITLHKHWLILVQKASAYALFFLLDLSVGLWFAVQVWTLNVLNLWFIGLAIFLIWLGSAFALGFMLWYRWEDWRNDEYIITNTRVIDIERKPFGFSETKSVVTYGKIQKSEKTRLNPIQLIFRYGTVEVFSASGEKALDFVNVPDPEKVEEEIIYRSELAKEREQTMTDQRIADFFALAAREKLFWPDQQPPQR